MTCFKDLTCTTLLCSSNAFRLAHELCLFALQEQQKKLRDEYLSFGGSANTAMGANYFLYIILGISFLAVLSWLTGAL